MKKVLVSVITLGMVFIACNAHAGIVMSSLIPGDANEDGWVDQTDLDIVLAHYNQTDSEWTDGNFNSDPWVNGADLNIVLSNYGEHNIPLTHNPEPASLAFVGFGLYGLLKFKKRKV